LEIYPANVIERLESLIEQGQGADVVAGFFTDVARMAADELAMLKSLPNWPARIAAARTIPREMRASEAYRFHADRFKALTVPTLLLLGGASPAFFKAATDLVHAGRPSIWCTPGCRRAPWSYCLARSTKRSTRRRHCSSARCWALWAIRRRLTAL
jgi:hypothetical protein